MADTIKRYTKSKGYESLPRELLQSKELSLGAIGLICNMISYSEEWVLRKVELRNRFKNGAKAVDRIWDELVDAGYIIQFRKRVGKVFDYRYYFDEQPFDLESTQELLESNFEEGYVLYHKFLNHTDGESINILDFIKCKNKENLDLSFWTSQNGKSNKPCNDTIPWSSHFGKSNLESPKREPNKLINNKINYKQKDDDDILLRESKSKMVSDLLTQDERLKDAAKYLFGSGLNWDTVQDIIIHLEDRDELLIPDLITKQYEWCVVKQRTTGISDFARYFIKGLEDKAKNYKAEIDTELRETYTLSDTYRQYKDIDIPIVEFNYGT